MSTCFHQESTASTRQGESFVLEGRFTFWFFYIFLNIISVLVFVFHWSRQSLRAMEDTLDAYRSLG
uniref:Uncharacterized protein n=1 Tax=Anguilla anguilla TaxID=7936 RepID=A0A0E9W750_ANGAN